METRNVSRQKYQEIMRQVDHYMCLRQFPLRLQKRVRLFYERKFMKTYFKEDIILDVISGLPSLILNSNKLKLLSFRALAERYCPTLWEDFHGKGKVTTRGSRANNQINCLLLETGNLFTK